jgi:hypothetical protein
VTLDDKWQPSYFLCYRVRWRPTTDSRSNIRIVSKRHSQILGNVIVPHFEVFVSAICLRHKHWHPYSNDQ